MAADRLDGQGNSQAAREASVTAISIPGQLGSNRRSRKIRAAEPTPTAIAAGLIVGSAWASAASFGNNGPSSAAGSFRPPRSLSWLAKIVTAIPQVKPTVTACGM